MLKLEQSLLNPDSTILNLLHVIKQLCSLGDKPEDLDLCTLQGVVANLTTASLRSSARPLLTDRTAYIVVKVISKLFCVLGLHYGFSLLSVS